MGKYHIRIVNYEGQYKQDVYDFVSLSILDCLNDIGRWEIKGKSEDRCNIAVDDCVIIYRDGVQIYNGIVTRVEQTYEKQSRAWSWSASGANSNLLLKYKVVFPDTLTPNNLIRMENRYYSYNDDALDVLEDLIVKNAKYVNDNSRLPRGVYMINGVQQAGAYHGKYISGTLRFENLLETVTGIANQVNIAILPVYGEGLSNGKITYVLVQKPDSVKVQFMFDFDEVESFSIVTETPSENMIIMSLNHETEDPEDEYGIVHVTDDLYHYYFYKAVSGSPEGIIKELFVEPNKSDIGEGEISVDDYQKIETLCQEEADSRVADVDGYEIALNMVNTQYVYGYTIDSERSFTTDYRLGDVIGVVFDGEKYSGRLTQMQFNVSYGKETIKATIGAKKRGQFGRIWDDLRNLNISMSKKNSAEVK